MTSLRRVLELVAAGEVRLDVGTVLGLEAALEIALEAYADDIDEDKHESPTGGRTRWR